MTTEEKAKAYDEALELARDYYKANLKLNNADENLLLEDIFPELKESEDERIRKSIICGMNALKEQGKETFATIPIDDAIAWLEKQGKKKSQRMIAAEAKEALFDYESANIQQKDFAPKQEWSEEDEEMAEDLIKGCLSSGKSYHLAHTSKEIADWLKSLKSKLQR